MKTIQFLALAVAGLLIAGCSDKSHQADSAQPSPAARTQTVDQPQVAAPAQPADQPRPAPDVALAGKLVLRGSDTLGEVLVPKLLQDFKALHPNVTSDLKDEGSTTGIVAIIDGTADIGMASRPAKTTEISLAKSKGVDMQPVVVAYDGIALIVNSANPLSSLTEDQIEKIFTGDVTNWSDVGGSPGVISVYTRNTSSGTYGVFKELAMEKRDYAPASHKMDGNEQIVAEVAKDPNGIGYVGLAYTEAAGIKAVPVNGILPNEASIKSKTYPLARPTFYYVNSKPSGLIAAFIDYTLSPAGQDTVRKIGFVPVK